MMESAKETDGRAAVHLTCGGGFNSNASERSFDSVRNIKQATKASGGRTLSRYPVIVFTKSCSVFLSQLQNLCNRLLSAVMLSYGYGAMASIRI